MRPRPLVPASTVIDSPHIGLSTVGSAAATAVALPGRTGLENAELHTYQGSLDTANLTPTFYDKTHRPFFGTGPTPYQSKLVTSHHDMIIRMRCR